MPLIDGPKPLPNSAFSASGILGSAHKPQYARLNSVQSLESSKKQNL